MQPFVAPQPLTWGKTSPKAHRMRRGRHSTRIEASAAISLNLPASSNTLFHFSPLVQFIQKPQAAPSTLWTNDPYLSNGIFGPIGDKNRKEKFEFMRIPKKSPPNSLSTCAFPRDYAGDFIANLN